jgi:hypothetical protein
MQYGCRDNSRRFAVGKMTHAFQDVTIVLRGEVPLEVLGFLWAVTIIRRSLNHQSGCGQPFHHA